MLTWRRLDPADFPLLATWLAHPHVSRWWDHDPTPEAVARDFGPAARGEEPSEDLLAIDDGEPVGLMQRCRLADYPGYLAEFTTHVEVPQNTMTIDYLVGDPTRVGQGIGTRMIASIVTRTWHEHPTTRTILVAVVAGNKASWRALEKAGATRVAEGDMTPDNPEDDRTHYIYRFDRTEEQKR